MTTPYAVLMSAAQGRRAIRRGQLADAERWFKLADKAAAIAVRLASLEREEAPKEPRWTRNPA